MQPTRSVLLLLLMLPAAAACAGRGADSLFGARVEASAATPLWRALLLEKADSAHFVLFDRRQPRSEPLANAWLDAWISERPGGMRAAWMLYAEGSRLFLRGPDVLLTLRAEREVLLERIALYRRVWGREGVSLEEASLGEEELGRLLFRDLGGEWFDSLEFRFAPWRDREEMQDGEVNE